MALMLPALCEAVEQPKCTNHQIRFSIKFEIEFINNLVIFTRTTSIIYMRRAGIPWLTIAKITGHQSIENLIKYYDLNLEACKLNYISMYFIVLCRRLVWLRWLVHLHRVPVSLLEECMRSWF